MLLEVLTCTSSRIASVNIPLLKRQSDTAFGLAMPSKIATLLTLKAFFQSMSSMPDQLEEKSYAKMFG